MIGGAWHCAQKELRIRLRDRWALVMWLLVPLSIGGMITALSGGDSPQPTVQLLVVDEDDSFLSNLIMGALGQAQDGQLIQAVRTTRDWHDLGTPRRYLEGVLDWTRGRTARVEPFCAPRWSSR